MSTHWCAKPRPKAPWLCTPEVPRVDTPGGACPGASPSTQSPHSSRAGISLAPTLLQPPCPVLCSQGGGTANTTHPSQGHPNGDALTPKTQPESTALLLPLFAGWEGRSSLDSHSRDLQELPGWGQLPRRATPPGTALGQGARGSHSHGKHTGLFFQSYELKPQGYKCRCLFASINENKPI